jgi:uncharacterized Zn finger protein
MSIWDRFYPRSRPRAAKGGIRPQSQRGSFGSNWWSARWIRVLEEFQLGARLSRGRSYARQGQVLSIDIAKGAVTSKVQGSRPRPYDVLIRLKPLSPSDWKRVARAISDQAKYVSKLLAGDMPMELEEIFARAGAPLFPARSDDLVTDCSCPDWSNPCKHIAAVYCLLAEEFARDPFLLFRLRGMERDELMALIGGDTMAGQAAPQGEADGAAKEPLPHTRSAYWAELRIPPDLLAGKPAATGAAALPRRLGSLPFWRGDTPLLPALDAIYAQAARIATDWMEGSATELPGLRAARSARARAARKAHASGAGPAPAPRISDDLSQAIRRIWPKSHTFEFDYEMESHLDTVGRKLERELRNLPGTFIRFHCLTVEGPARSYMLYFLGIHPGRDAAVPGWLLGVSMLEPVAVLQLDQYNEHSESIPSLRLDAVTDEYGSVRHAAIRREVERILSKYGIRLLTEEECHAVAPGLLSPGGAKVTVFDAFFYEALED